MTALNLKPDSIHAHMVAIRMLLQDLQPKSAQHLLDRALVMDPNVKQIKTLKAVQIRILRMSRQAENRPLNWLARKFNRRISNAAGENENS